ncbi:vegetative cell wall protein gp1 [Dactylonectria estremocensis]|uniref:Vegetative cell wall protein gp1 n=1 Tax=Dactylonectria estremocensis TaxID=1079267 RepID=A0A9P9IBJ3_9HYPO|nr:vegetative cell wall protein gp1 [Dactylonectria estremocensis]
MSNPSFLEDGSNPNRKRPRISGMYQRKRAVAACQPCRVRKTKCDNIKPACGFCARNGAQCTYADTASDHSSFDPASLAILERLGHVVSLLETRQPPSSPQDSSLGMQKQPSQAILNAAPPNRPADQNSEDDLLEETPNFPAAIYNCESVLRWPIFQGIVPDIESFVTWPDNTQTASSMSSWRDSGTLSRGVQEEDFIPLSRRFLAYVHTKNPILDVAELSRYVRDAAEHGLRWDGPSCLVLITCALGSISMPFQENIQATDSQPNPAPASNTMGRSAAYYLAAKKRLGLMEPSSLQIQCLFLCGVLEMYYMDALRAWHFFNQACVQFRNLLWRHGNPQFGSDRQPTNETRRLEQRLYWSCMKSECELRCEIALPASGISRFGFPNVFPSPPNELSPSAASSHEHSSSAAGSSPNPEEERSWFYYLAEISFRRMMNRAFTALGISGEAGWIRDFQENLNKYTALKDQIDAWYSHIPAQINISQGGGVSNELAHFVRARAFGYQEWIHRPFLYYVIHQEMEDPYISQAVPLAEKCLDLCVQHQLIVHLSHHHHGTWYVARSSITRAALLIAAARSKRIQLPDRWRDAIDSALQTIQYWEDKAPDLRRGGEVLRNLMQIY